VGGEFGSNSIPDRPAVATGTPDGRRLDGARFGAGVRFARPDGSADTCTVGRSAHALVPSSISFEPPDRLYRRSPPDSL
jgi:hypothetical protein